MKKYIKNRAARISIYILGILLLGYLLLSLLLHFYTKDIIENVVSSQTKGKVKVRIGRVALKIFPSTRLDLLNTDLKFLDETGKNEAFKVSFTYLGLQLHSLSDFIFDKKLEVDFLVAENPHVEISPALKKKRKEGNSAVHFEIGNVFLAIKNIAEELSIKRFGILNGKITLLNLAPNQTTISMGGVNFTAKDLAVLGVGLKDSSAWKAGTIRLNTGVQAISLPEGNLSMTYTSLHLDTEEKLITIDSLSVKGQSKKNDFGKIDAGFSKFKIYNFDFGSLYTNNLIKIDSLICVDPRIDLKMDITRFPGEHPTSDLPIQKRIAATVGKTEIGYLGFLNSKLDVETRNGTKVTPFHSAGSSFEVSNIRIDSTAEKPVDIGRLTIGIRNYSASTRDSLYTYYFDSVIYDNDILSLRNFHLEPSASNKRKDQKWLAVPDFQIHGLSLSELMTTKKFKAKELVIRNTIAVNYFYPAVKKTDIGPTPFRVLLNQISDRIDIDKLIIDNGFLLSQSVKDKNNKVIIQGFNSEISVNDVFDASTYEIMGYSIGKVGFDSFTVRRGDLHLNLSKGEILGREKKIRAKNLLVLQQNTSTRIRANNIQISNYHFDDEFENIIIDSVVYGSADIEYHQVEKGKTDAPSNAPAKRNLLIGFFRANDTRFNLVSDNGTKASANIQKIQLRKIQFGADKSISLADVDIAGTGASYTAPGVSAKMGAFSVLESKTSSIRNISLQIEKEDTIRANIPELEFTAQISKSLENKYPIFGAISVSSPFVYAAIGKNQNKGSNPQNNNNSSLSIDQIQIKDGHLDIHQRSGNKSLQAATKDLDITIHNIQKNIGQTSFGIGKSSYKAHTVSLTLNDSIHLSLNNGLLDLELDHLVKGREQEAGKLDANLSSITLKGLDFSMINKKGKPIEIRQIEAGGQNIDIDSAGTAHILGKIRSNPSIYAGNINYFKKDDKSDIAAYGVTLRNGGNLVTIDSFRYKPAISIDSFNKTLQYQKDYMTATSGMIRIHDFDPQRLATDSTYAVRSIELESPRISIYKDKRIPFQHGIIKPLPVDMLKSMSRHIQADSIRLNNASVLYEEMNDVTNTLGTIKLDHIRALIRNIKNSNLNATDSLKLLAYARFMDTVNVRLHFDQSYTDTLSAFYFSVRVGKLSLPVLNEKLLMPLANAKVIRGELDTLQLRAIGREYIAHGKMKMQYRDLKVEFLNKKDQGHRTVMTKFLSWIANSLVRDTNKKTGDVFAQRVRERSVFNYWIKIVLGGTLTNAGIRSNTKSEKKYKKTLRKINVPEIPDVQL